MGVGKEEEVASGVAKIVGVSDRVGIWVGLGVGVGVWVGVAVGVAATCETCTDGLIDGMIVTGASAALKCARSPMSAKMPSPSRSLI